MLYVPKIAYTSGQCNLAAAAIELPCYLGNVSGTCVERVDLNDLCWRFLPHGLPSTQKAPILLYVYWLVYELDGR